MTTQPSVALVYDWVTTTHGGAERVLLSLHELFPDAPLYTALYNPDQARWAQVFDVKTTWLQTLPRWARRHQWLAFLLPLAFESLNFDAYELIISVSSGPAAKGIITTPDQHHLTYLLTPPRYLYTHQSSYLKEIPWWARGVAKLGMRYLRWWDQAAAARPDHLIPISQVVADRIKLYYHRDPLPVIYPPLSLPPTPSGETPTQLPQLPDNFLLVVSRLVKYKRVDLAIRACQNLEKPLIIVGDGPARPSLEKVIQQHPFSNIHLLGSLSDETISWLYSRCQAVLMPGEEDFGIVGLEAMAAGRPTIVHHQSGVAELVRDKKEGIHLSHETLTDLKVAILKLEETHFNEHLLSERSTRYTTEVFKENWKKVISKFVTKSR